jgi:predicted oxidoreductase
MYFAKVNKFLRKLFTKVNQFLRKQIILQRKKKILQNVNNREQIILQRRKKRKMRKQESKEGIINTVNRYLQSICFNHIGLLLLN